MVIKALNGQSLFDLAIQTAGSAEAAFELAMANDLALTDEVVVGSDVDSVEVANTDIATYYSNKRLTPATAETNEGTKNIAGEGINFMGIEIDFIIS